MTVERRYWDSVCFLAWLSNEKSRVKNCKGIINGAESGKIEIVTSALTIAEVLYLKGYQPIPKDKSEIIENFFKNSYIIVVGVDRYTAEEARELIWKHGIKPKDAIHVATAIRAGVLIFDTFDNGLTKFSGKIGTPPLLIAEPNYVFQESLF